MASSDSPVPLPAPSSTSSRVSSGIVGKAVDALLKWNESKKKKLEKAQLLEQDDFLYLILTLKKIPANGRTNPYKIPLSHPLHSPEEELCLIIDDRSKNRLTSEAAKKKIQAEGIPISKVLKLSKLKTDYRPFEAKRKLCSSYDLFFADKRIIPLLPKLLGKEFFKKKKIPIPVDLTHQNWKQQIEYACGSALLFLRTGTCSVLKIARVSQSRDEIVANVVSAIDGTTEIIPKKWANVRSFHLKMSESLALPLYQSVPDMVLKIDGINKKEESKEELSAGESGKDAKLKDGKKSGKKKLAKKGRIHEVRYMDNNPDELLGGDELGGDEDSDDGEDNDSYDLGTAELTGKKRKKVHRVKEDSVLNELNGEKQPKKPEKVNKGDAVKKKKGRVSSESGSEAAAVDHETSGAMNVADGPKKIKKGKLGKLEGVEMKIKYRKSTSKQT
ncbi:putative ribosome biogenesis protein C8F11.04 [Macadamia integrifolia]|uniref:putative ribosome biogenesis protein C8F11.04 n=1 Tax=Macadamia integrifolia TaxID=60698 RepID=UPI001C534138|nr:putative ribosome biogenesis protein C8F11.04 [Macadamia integrifolia]